MSKLANYVRFDYDNPDFQVKIGEKESRLGIHDIKVFATFSKPEHIEKFLVFGSEVMIDIAPYMKAYDMLMRNYLAQEFNVHPIDIKDKWTNQCWNCTNTQTNLLSCSFCKIAKYCSRECQKEDFDVHKMLHKTKRDLVGKESQLEYFQEYCRNLVLGRIAH
jgi:hypothetical protein